MSTSSKFRTALMMMIILWGCSANAQQPESLGERSQAWSPRQLFGGGFLATDGDRTTAGSADGSIVPWAVVSGYDSAGQIGGGAFLTGAQPQDVTSAANGGSFTLFNRVEMRLTQRAFYLRGFARAPGETDATLRRIEAGAKLRLFGDLVGSAWPQISVGLQYKGRERLQTPSSVATRRHSDLDIYLSVSKLWLAGPVDRSWFANVTLRSTRANQLGLRGFGSEHDNARSLLFEASGGLFLNRYWAIGAEYRQKPDQLGLAQQRDWHDVFVGWFPNKHMAIIGAHTRFGPFSEDPSQDAWYLKTLVNF